MNFDLDSKMRDMLKFLNTPPEKWGLYGDAEYLMSQYSETECAGALAVLLDWVGYDFDWLSRSPEIIDW